MQDIQPLKDLIAQGHRQFWILEFNTQDWVYGRLSKDQIIIDFDDDERFYNLESIELCPSIAIIKPERKVH